MFLQEELIQYDTCNASAGSGLFTYSGYCNGDTAPELMLTLTINSQNLMNTVNFKNNSLFYLTSTCMVLLVQAGRLDDA